MSPISTNASANWRWKLALSLGVVLAATAAVVLWHRGAAVTEWEEVARLHREDVKAARHIGGQFGERREVKPWGFEARFPAGWTCREGETDGITSCRSESWALFWSVHEGADKTAGRVLADWAEHAQIRSLQSSADSPGAPAFVARAALAGYDGYITVERTSRRPFVAYTFQGWRNDGSGGQRKLQVRAETSSQTVIASLTDHPAEGLAVLLTTAQARRRDR